MATRTPTKSTKTSAPSQEPEGFEVRYLPIDDVIPSAHNLRSDLGDLTGLAASIRDAGVKQPLLVRVHADQAGKWELVIGHRRLAAARLAGKDHVPCYFDEISDEQRDEIMLIENLQREGLEPLDEATGYQRLVTHGWSQRQIAERIGCSQPHISRRLKLLTLPEKARDALHAGRITIEDAGELARIADQPDTVEKIVERATSRARHDQFVSSIDHQVDQHIRDQKTAKKVGELTDKFKGQGVPIVERAPYEQRLTHLGFTAAKHKKEPCHAVAILDYYDDVETEFVCTEPKRHAKNGPSDLKSAVVDNSGRVGAHNAKETAERAAAVASAKARRTYAAQLVAGDAPRSQIIDLALRAYLADAASNERGAICKLLGLEFGKKENAINDASDVLDGFAGASETNLLRACRAFWLVQGEDRCKWGASPEYFRYLERHGYELSAWELDRIKDHEDDQALERAENVALDLDVDGESPPAVDGPGGDADETDSSSSPAGPIIDDEELWDEQLRDAIRADDEGDDARLAGVGALASDGTTQLVDDVPDPRRHMH